jgi:hypothetical protein
MDNVITVDFKKKKDEKNKLPQVKESIYGYDDIMRKAMYQIFTESIEMIMKYGVPEYDDHKVYITFLTHYDGVQLSEDLKTTYPEQITIILQHQYRNLQLDGDAFLVDLSFNSIWQTVRVPFKSIKEIADPAIPIAFRAI